MKNAWLAGCSCILLVAGCGVDADRGGAGDESGREIYRDTAVERADPAAARVLLQQHFEAVVLGDDVNAPSAWCDTSDGATFAKRLERFGEFRINIADPLPHAPGAVSISLQLLTPDNSSIADGAAILESSVPGASESWCIRQIGLQQPPTPIGLETNVAPTL